MRSAKELRRGLLFAGVLGAWLTGAGNALAVYVNVLTAGAPQETEKVIAEEYRRATGNGIVFISGTTGQIQEKLKSGAAADVVVLAAPPLKELEEPGETRTGAHVLGRIGIGVGIKEDAPVLDISTPEKFKEAVLRAKAITYMDPAAGASSGIATAKILKDLGIADEVAKKTTLHQSGYSADRVAAGEADLAIQNVSEIIAVKGVKLAGMLPDALQVFTTYSAAVATKSIHPKAATDFIRFLTHPEAAPHWNEAGIEPAVH